MNNLELLLDGINPMCDLDAVQRRMRGEPVPCYTFLLKAVKHPVRGAMFSAAAVYFLSQLNL